METAIFYIYAAATGLAAGGISVSAYRMATNRLPSFQAQPANVFSALLQVPVLVFGGPLVLMRNAIRGRILESRPLPFLAATAVIASLWCFFSGVFLLTLVAGRV